MSRTSRVMAMASTASTKAPIRSVLWPGGLLRPAAPPSSDMGPIKSGPDDLVPEQGRNERAGSGALVQPEVGRDRLRALGLDAGVLALIGPVVDEPGADVAVQAGHPGRGVGQVDRGQQGGPGLGPAALALAGDRDAGYHRGDGHHPLAPL